MTGPTVVEVESAENATGRKSVLLELPADAESNQAVEEAFAKFAKQHKKETAFQVLKNAEKARLSLQHPEEERIYSEEETISADSLKAFYEKNQFPVYGSLD